MNISQLYVLINHIHHIIILLVYNFLAIMKKTTKIQKKFDPSFVSPEPSWSLVYQWPTVQQSQDKYQK
jgi:hypothetical protein